MDRAGVTTDCCRRQTVVGRGSRLQRCDPIGHSASHVQVLFDWSCVMTQPVQRFSESSAASPGGAQNDKFAGERRFPACSRAGSAPAT